MEAFVVAFSIGTMEVIAMEIMEVVSVVEVRIMPWIRAVIAVPWIEVVIYRAIKAAMPVEPGTGSDKRSTVEPLRTVIAVRGAAVWGVAVVAIRADRRSTDVDAEGDLSFGSCR